MTSVEISRYALLAIFIMHNVKSALSSAIYLFCVILIYFVCIYSTFDELVFESSVPHGERYFLGPYAKDELYSISRAFAIGQIF